MSSKRYLLLGQSAYLASDGRLSGITKSRNSTQPFSVECDSIPGSGIKFLPVFILFFTLLFQREKFQIKHVSFIFALCSEDYIMGTSFSHEQNNISSIVDKRGDMYLTCIRRFSNRLVVPGTI